jgi:hypothetical protein
VDLYTTLFEVIDMRSFSNLWYWIALAVLWSSTSHWVLGVPFDMVSRARREGGQAQADVEDMARIYAGRIVAIVDTAPVLMVTLACFWMSILVILAFFYWVEFAQAVFFLFCPMIPVVWLSQRTARQVLQDDATGDALHRRLKRLRITIQIIGMVALFATSMWGMWQNFNISILK